MPSKIVISEAAYADFDELFFYLAGTINAPETARSSAGARAHLGIRAMAQFSECAQPRHAGLQEQRFYC